MTSPVSLNASRVIRFSDRSPHPKISPSLPSMYSAKSWNAALYLVTSRMMVPSSVMKWDGYTLSIQKNHQSQIQTLSVSFLRSYMRSNILPAIPPYFSLLIHSRFVEYYLHIYNPIPFPLDKFPSLSTLCEAVLRKFSRKNLLASVNTSQRPFANSRPPEAQFQDEWYRAFYSVVGHGVAISSEWSRAGDGRIDFRIIDPTWGIELLRDGDRLTEHCDRFRHHGAYHTWITDGLIEDWLILDCRHTPPKKYGMKYFWESYSHSSEANDRHQLYGIPSSGE
jgi:hypothetical protein